MPTILRSTGSDAKGQRSRGQVVVIFAGAAILFLLLCAAVVDISWYWTNNMRMQRAADAAALAGVVFLPGNPSAAFTAAQAEAVKNGYTDGTDGFTVLPALDGNGNRRLKVTINGPVGTFFARVIGINSWPASRTARADYILPVPMGSPENYYGVFGKVRHPGGGVTTTTTNVTHPTTTYFLPTTSPSGNWTSPANGYLIDGVFTTRNSTTNPYEAYGTFGVSLLGTGTNAIEGITVEVKGKSSDTAGCSLGVALSWNAATVTGAGWTTSKTQALTGGSTVYTLGSAADLWGRAWTPAELTNANFRIRVENVDPDGAGGVCVNNSTTSLDYVRVRITYQNTLVTTTTVPDVNVASPYGAALTPRGFWGTMLSEGADNMNGDAYLPFYDQSSTGDTNANYDAGKYYDYAVEMPAGSSGGEVWVFDPGFCAVDFDEGTGDRYFNNANVNGSNEISAFYRLYDTKNTLYDESDDGAPVATSGNLFRQLAAADTSMMAGAFSMTNLSDCSATAIGGNTADPEYYHDRWYELASGLPGGTTYRLQTSSTDPALPNDQKNKNGQNSFAIWTKATGGTPKVHGLGAMEAYSPLDQGASSAFYLAQIGAEHAGKSVQIKLWDPGDTNGLTSNIQILVPTAAGYSAATLQYTALRGTTNTGANNCDSTNLSGQPSVITNTGGANGQLFNGCWVTINIPIPSNYTAPTPPGEAEPGWWKIQYNVGPGATNGYDLTTWQVEIRGNPVHLILP